MFGLCLQQESTAVITALLMGGGNGRRSARSKLGRSSRARTCDKN